MKSIKEKANELYPELHTDSDDWDVIEEQCDRDDQRKAFVLGANYVLEQIENIIVNNEDNTLNMARCLMECIEQLKK